MGDIFVGGDDTIDMHILRIKGIVYVYVLYVCEKDIKTIGLVLGLEKCREMCLCLCIVCL